MSDWTAGEAMGTLTRLHATAAPAPQVGGLEEDEEGEGGERLTAKVLLTEDHCVALHGWLWHPVGDRASVRGLRAVFGTGEHNSLAGQLREWARGPSETETHTEKNAPVTPEGGKWRGVVAERAREPGTARSSRQPAPPLGTHRA